MPAGKLPQRHSAIIPEKIPGSFWRNLKGLSLKEVPGRKRLSLKDLRLLPSLPLRFPRR
jgi:hypothetical protein